MGKTYKVYIDAGHGGSDSGAVKYVREKDVNLTMALACRDYLQASGVSVKMSRTSDKDTNLNNICKAANDWGADLAASLHNNAGGGDGFEIYHSINGGKGKTLAKNIEAEVKKLGQNSRGLKTRRGTNGDYYGFIRMTDMPAVICEGAFVDNKTDVKAIDSVAEQKAFGYAYARGILKTLEVADKGFGKSTTTTAKKSVATSSTKKAAIPKKVASKVVTASIKAKGKDYKLADHFTLGEFQCHNGADTVKYDKQTVTALEAARLFFGVPITVSSAYRPVAYNKSVGGATGSYHVKGRAVDHYCKLSYTLLAKFYEVYGLKGIGCYYDDHFVHIDSRDSKFFWKNQSSTPVSTHLVVVKNGSGNQHVKDLQWLLKNKHGITVTIDGEFGTKTDTAVRTFQKKHGLTVDGIVGAKTWKKLLAV